MLLNKTGKAREALQAGTAAGLALADRRVLILVDGKRSLDQLVGMLGTGILPVIDRLLREDYLVDAASASDARTRAAGLGDAVAGLVRATADVVQARAERIRAGAVAAPPFASGDRRGAAPTAAAAADASTPRAQARPAGARRSLAACKMYLLDMLQLQRTPEAAELRAAIQCATDPALLVDALLRALRMIVATSNASYGERVTQRLLEILPLEALPRLEAMRAERSAAPPSLSIVA